ncbi:hypothetical protein COCC4DRAFT_57830 [Bipolaris maydis ATCC 48331]|uniref:Uncharacterized protein n=2 Tax=Cochliobolus heterostrophus TaxID=5016 RepID=M2U160_COCH5|nr:uncharacterized protein COCC4DRAFT_57830 [Bipolaris maydis ATCC 48331]EMD92279.1 hypothetical protein COCHEDRAFT_1213351 [Bipolaris maydis C5]ENI07971.1 hypothetical protein COCC4DRAFT_57830 [Bipolaris maydis ATCC 48331]
MKEEQNDGEGASANVEIGIPVVSEGSVEKRSKNGRYAEGNSKESNEDRSCAKRHQRHDYHHGATTDTYSSDTRNSQTDNY